MDTEDDVLMVDDSVESELPEIVNRRSTSEYLKANLFYMHYFEAV